MTELAPAFLHRLFDSLAIHAAYLTALSWSWHKGQSSAALGPRLFLLNAPNSYKY